MRDGATDYLVKPFDSRSLKATIDRHLRTLPVADRPVAEDPSTIELLRVAARVARSDATVTLSGESGTGKEVVARFIHQQSPRRDRPFVAINCAAIPDNMLEAMLFGHVKGAFTGASAASAGKFELANGGTLLLDEVSEMDLALQAKILRVIQEREVERIGGHETIALDVRVLATTNKDLRQHVADGHFREDLYYRLNVFPLHIPPLRERKADILPLARHIIQGLHEEGAVPAMTEDAEQRLLAYGWPGNVRELENLLQRSLIMLAGASMTSDDLVFEDVSNESTSAADQPAALQDDLRRSEFQLIVDALRDSHGNRTETASRLGISPRTLRYKLKRLREEGLDLPADVAQRAH